MKQAFIFILVSFCSYSISWGQNDPLLAKYRQMAVDYQQQIKIANRQMESADARLEAAKSDFLPKFDLSADYNYYAVPLKLAPSSDNPTLPGAELNNKYAVHLTMNQPIYTGGYLKNTKLAAMSDADRMRDLVRLSQQDMILTTDILYWQAIARKETNLLSIKYRDAIGEFLKVVRDRVEEEIVGPNELYQAMVRFNDAEYQVISTDKDFKVSRMELNRILGLAPDFELEVPDSLTTVIWQSPSENIDETALATRPEISMLQNQILLNEYLEKLNIARYNPSLGITLDGKWGSPSPGLLPEPAFNFIAGAQLIIPIFYWGKKNEERLAYQKQTEISRLQLAETKDKVKLEVNRSLLELASTYDQLQVARKSLSNAGQNVTVMVDRYHEGLSSVLDVLEAQLYWQKTYLNYIQAKYQQDVAYSQYLKATGEFGQP